ncbi:PREDICTED: uncharacterized protein LOC109147385 [Ipomoea nil]|uniref:uncharacterized protein LOC109147385 n=1 Tax=Ipomoea nil TaxID=35883 RepID=UPI000901F2F4|nr:PREDICTED: uncharacterized protein LOC109147385 [Ipomoea nil]
MQELEEDENEPGLGSPLAVGPIDRANLVWAPRRRPGAEGRMGPVVPPQDFLMRALLIMLILGSGNEVPNLLYVHLTGKVGLWYDSYIHGLMEEFHWPRFVEAICRRFGDSKVSVMEDFAAFKQWGNVDDFTDEFEEFMSLLLQIHPCLTETYFMENYIARLRQNLRCFVRTARPRDLADAIWFARQYEKGLKPVDTPRNSAWNTRNNQPTKTTSSSSNSPLPNIPIPKPILPTSTQNSTQTTAAKTPEITQFRNQLREQKRCFRCFDPWQPGHKCKGLTFNIIEDQDEEDVPILIEHPEDEQTEVAGVSLCAVVGGEGLNTIKLLGMVQKQPIVILVDSGSTHSFLDPKILSQLRREPRKCTPSRVTVANGDQITSDSMCSELQWHIQQESFVKGFRLLRLGGCDMVLGMDWVDQFAPIQLHTRPPGISFHKEGKKVFLKGLTRKTLLQAATKKEVKNWHKNGVQGLLVQCLTSLPETSLENPHCYLTTTHDLPSNLAAILEEFQDLFQEPTTLPPQRIHDHAIPLIPGAQPINIRPYRYSFDQKNVIETMVEEMLATGVITPSTSCFASPVLLVPKKDNTWRFCVDYRALNSITIKNKFPIPLIEDLFSELAGARYFSKLDLRSGYHQVRMKEGEEFKTAFRTHQGIYEFRVMPFGLTNARATFQAMMNHILKPLLRKSVLVFFDDILVYSSSLEDHWGHLREVLSLMRQNLLLAKLSKCSLVQTQVEYLGHIITQEGLQTDPSKLDVVAA